MIEKITDLKKSFRVKFDQYVSDSNDFSKKIELLENKIILQKKCSHVFVSIIENIFKEKSRILENLISYGVRSIFTDLNLSCKIDFEIKRNQCHVTLTTINQQEDFTVVGKALTTGSGGVADVEGFLLRMLLIQQFGLVKFIVLDESFAHISPEYRENASFFMKKICEEMGFDVLMITQNRDFAEHSNLNYWASSKNGELQLQVK